MNKKSNDLPASMTEVLQGFQETKKMFQETDRKFQESERLLTEKFHETDRKFQESARLLTEKFRETDKLLNNKFQETDRKIKELATLFTGQWGKLVEALLGPGCMKLFNDIGIKVNHASSNVIVKKEGRVIMEIDVLLVNNNEIVVIEVKTKSDRKDIERILEVLQQFKKHFTHYRTCKVYGAIAALRYEQRSDKYAEENGLFVIKSSGEGLMKIINRKGFTPKGY